MTGKGAANAPKFKMERVRGDLPPDTKPKYRGRSPVYKKQLEGAVEYYQKTNAANRSPWWLIAEHSERRGSEAVLAKFAKGAIELPRGTSWEFETRETDEGKGQLYGRILGIEPDQHVG